MSPEKLILTDCDGVLLNWNSAFGFWMKKQGYTLHHEQEYDIGKRYEITAQQGADLVAKFNSSPEVGILPPFRDAVAGVRKLYHEHGFRFVVISSLSGKPEAAKYRKQNLIDVFVRPGCEPIAKVICLPIGADKKPSLKPYADSGLWWIEDKPENAVAGLELGLRPILVTHPYNDYTKLPKMPHADNWVDIVRIITS